eukprot:scaffold25906_cov86-Skeletonema_dohrnii-CCMP3373.AAC.3
MDKSSRCDTPEEQRRTTKKNNEEIRLAHYFILLSDGRFQILTKSEITYVEIQTAPYLKLHATIF